MNDEVSGTAIMNTKSVKFTLMCGVQGRDSITVEEIRKSFEVTGVFPVDWNIPQKFKTKNEVVKEAARVEKLTLEKSFLASRIPSVMKRRADLKPAEDIRRIQRPIKSDPKDFSSAKGK